MRMEAEVWTGIHVEICAVNFSNRPIGFDYCVELQCPHIGVSPFEILSFFIPSDIWTNLLYGSRIIERRCSVV